MYNAVTGGNVCISFIHAYVCRRWLLTEGRISRFWQWRWTFPTGWRVTSLGGASTTGQTQTLLHLCPPHCHIWCYYKVAINCGICFVINDVGTKDTAEVWCIPVLYVQWLFLSVPTAEFKNTRTKKWLEIKNMLLKHFGVNCHVISGELLNILLLFSKTYMKDPNFNAVCCLWNTL